MIIAIVSVLGCGLLFGLLAPRLAARAHSKTVLWTLALGGLGLATATWVTFGVIAVTGLAQTSVFARLDGLSGSSVATHSPFPRSAATLAGLALVVLAVQTLRRVHGDVLQLRSAWAASASTNHDLVVLDEDKALAYAIPGSPRAGGGRIVVSRGVLRSLSPDGRRALLAHERAHLTQHHEIPVLAAAAACAALPLLHGLPAAVRTACERSADEAAARSVGDRRLVAEAIAHVALSGSTGVVFGGGGADVPLRARSLLSPASPRAAGLGAVIPLVLVGVCFACVLRLGHDLDGLFDASRLIGAYR